MQRTPEPELMDEMEQAAAYAGADWSEAHNKVPMYFQERFPWFKSGRVLDLGCGTADVTVRFVKAFPDVIVTGVDGSEAMLGFARQNIRDAGLETKIAVENCFLPDKRLETYGFDAVLCNSLLHHFADPVALWRTAVRAVRPGGAILMVDLVRPPDHDTAVQLVQEHAKGAPPVLERDFTASLHAAYTIEEVQQQLKAANLEHFKVDRVDVLHLVAWGQTA